MILLSVIPLSGALCSSFTKLQNRVVHLSKWCKLNVTVKWWKTKLFFYILFIVYILLPIICYEKLDIDEIKWESSLSDYLFIICGLEQKIALLRAGFEFLRKESDVMQRRMKIAERENRRLLIKMMNFDF